MPTAELDALYETSKDDRAIIVGSNIRHLIGEIRYHRRLSRVDDALARRLTESMRNNTGLSTVILKQRRALTMVLTALEMVRDANRDEPHIPPAALAAIEHAIRITTDELDGSPH